MVQTCKLKDNLKEPAGVKSRKTYCYILTAYGHAQNGKKN